HVRLPLDLLPAPGEAGLAGPYPRRCLRRDRDQHLGQQQGGQEVIGLAVAGGREEFGLHVVGRREVGLVGLVGGGLVRDASVGRGAVGRGSVGRGSWRRGGVRRAVAGPP